MAFDVFKSLVRQSLDQVGARVGGNPLAESLSGALTRMRELLVQRELVVPLRVVSDALSRADALAQLSVAVTESGGLHVDAHFDREDADLKVVIEVDGVTFAPRGAKELRLWVEPEELAGDSRVRQLASILAGVVVHTLWSFVVGPPGRDLGGAFVELGREPGTLQVDLRTVPALRERLRGNQTAAMLLDGLSLEGARFSADGLRLQLAIPHMP